MALASGAALAAMGAYTLFITLGARSPYIHLAWQVFLGCFLVCAAAASTAGSLAQSPRLASLLLAIPAGTLAALALVFVFSIGVLLLPLALGAGFAAYAKSKDAGVAPAALGLAASAPCVLLFCGLLGFYR
jgi:hypothetical protein